MVTVITSALTHVGLVYPPPPGDVIIVKSVLSSVRSPFICQCSRPLSFPTRVQGIIMLICINVLVTVSVGGYSKRLVGRRRRTRWLAGTVITGWYNAHLYFVVNAHLCSYTALSSTSGSDPRGFLVNAKICKNPWKNHAWASTKLHIWPLLLYTFIRIVISF